VFEKMFSNLTHEELLEILPFECSYACNDKGEPCPTSVTVALMLQSIVALTQPMTYKTNEQAN
jgi:hypothetical protein